MNIWDSQVFKSKFSFDNTEVKAKMNIVMTRMVFAFLSIFILFIGQPVIADLEVNFIESAPKDRFIIKNTGECVLKDLVLEIDLSESTGRLIFDTTATGAGVDVFQPFEVTEGEIELISSAAVEDGDTTLSLRIQNLPAGKAISFTIDVDDTLTASELGKTRVADSEISNGLVKARLREQEPVIATFGNNSKATVLLPTCP